MPETVRAPAAAVDFSRRLAQHGVPISALLRTYRLGQAVFQQVCTACHGAGIAGAPKVGDKGAWSPRIAEGFDTLVSHATNGYKSMPAKGGDAGAMPRTAPHRLRCV